MITWHSDSGESVRFVITAHGETVSEVEAIQSTLLESENSPFLTLQVSGVPTPTTQSAASARNTANLVALTVCSLLAWTLLFRGTFSNVLLIAVMTLLLGGMWYTDAQQSSESTANVDVHIPRYDKRLGVWAPDHISGSACMYFNIVVLLLFCPMQIAQKKFFNDTFGEVGCPQISLRRNFPAV